MGGCHSPHRKKTTILSAQHTQFFFLYVLIQLARSHSVFSPTSLCHSSVAMQIHNQSDFSRQEVLSPTTILCMRDSLTVLSLGLQLITRSGYLPNRTPGCVGVEARPGHLCLAMACFPIPLRSCLNRLRKSCEWFSTSMRTGKSCIQC